MDIMVYNELKSINKKRFEQPKVFNYTVTYNAPVLHEYVDDQYGVTIINKNRYCSIDVKLDANLELITIPPSSNLVLDGRVKSLKVFTKFSPCDFTVIHGGKTLVNSKEALGSLEYKCSSDNVLAVKKDISYKFNDRDLFKSSDCGLTYKIVKSLESGDFWKTVHIGMRIVIAISNLGKIFYSKDNGETFTQSNQTNIPSTLRQPFYHGIDSYLDTIVFAEYGTDSSREYNVYTSTDGGISWQVTLSKTNGVNFRHFHSVNYNPYTNKFIVTSGDKNNEIHWWESSDGLTWTEMDIPKSQRYRVLNFIFLNEKEILWASDSVGDYIYAEVCKANIIDIKNTTEVIMTLPHAGWVLAGGGDLIVIGTSTESTDINDKNANLYVSRDGGKTFKKEIDAPIEPTQTIGGFRYLRGINSNNEIVMSIYNISGVPSSVRSLYVKVE